MANRNKVGRVVVVLLAVTLSVWYFNQPRMPERVPPRPAPAKTIAARASTPDPGGPLYLSLLRTFGDEASFGLPLDVLAVGHSLVVIDRQPLHGDEKVLVFDKETGVIRGRAGSRGQGPGDISDSIFAAVLPGSRTAFSVYDNTNKRLIVYELEPWTGEPTRTIGQGDGKTLFYAGWLNDNIVVGGGYLSGEILRFYGAERDDAALTYKFGAGRSLFPDESPRVVRALDWNQMAMKPDGEKIVTAFRSLSRLHIYDAAGNLLNEAVGPKEVVPHYQVINGRISYEHENGLQPAYVDVAATEDHIYALFSGVLDPDPALAQEIHVFSWDGELLGTYLLEEGIYFFTIDPETMHVFGIRHDPFGAVLEFEAPPI